MELVARKSFVKDIKKIKDEKLKTKIKTIVELMINSKSLDAIPNVVKIQNHTSAYRIRIGEYRLGFFCQDKCVELIRFLKRNDIYKHFPK
ncbi:MAG: plasmid stabilization protein [Flavobacteriales bacterium]|nr:plasmid stabilization protein [Flavobacteriales bacterium]